MSKSDAKSLMGFESIDIYSAESNETVIKRGFPKERLKKVRAIDEYKTKDVDEYTNSDWVHYFNHKLSDNGGRFIVKNNKADRIKAHSIISNLMENFSPHEIKKMIDLVTDSPQEVKYGFNINSISISILSGGWIPTLYGIISKENAPVNVKPKTSGEWKESERDNDFFDA